MENGKRCATSSPTCGLLVLASLVYLCTRGRRRATYPQARYYSYSYSYTYIYVPTRSKSKNELRNGDWNGDANKLAHSRPKSER